ncbi:peptide deformylase [Oscillatoria sp. CS-180]|uniref:peptide deformylase n=1 Tax=Oscillatoria sp. CS-180 TaxID=3021720 RepID=UPI00232DCA14|nr:peptide deformylase [Oscillatoria sp. CS-180]MDB9527610.1 peptide deformylase [Oscillatoria sp. CS-180]
MNEQLNVLTLEDPRLRQRAKPVDKIDDVLQTLIDDLIWTAERTNGVGISAPQVGSAQRLFIVASRPNLRYPHAPQMAPTAMINPRIVAHSEEQVSGWEGCLSVPDQRGKVDRWRDIEVEYCDRNGNLRRPILTGFVARIFQHELDHLEGTVFLDRVADPATLLTEAEYFAQIDTVPVSQT